MRTPFEFGIVGHIVRGIAKPGENPMRPVFGHATGTFEHFFLANVFEISAVLAQEVNVVVSCNPELLQVCPGGLGIAGIAVTNEDDTGTRESADLGDKLLRAGNQSGLLF